MSAARRLAFIPILEAISEELDTFVSSFQNKLSTTFDLDFCTNATSESDSDVDCDSTSTLVADTDHDETLVSEPTAWSKPCNKPKCINCAHMETASSYYIGDTNVLIHARKPFDCYSKNVVFVVECHNEACPLGYKHFQLFTQSSAVLCVNMAARMRRVKSETGSKVSALTQHFTFAENLNDPTRCSIRFMRIIVLQSNFGDLETIAVLRKMRQARKLCKRSFLVQTAVFQEKPLRVCPAAEKAIKDGGCSRNCSTSCVACRYVVCTKEVTFSPEMAPHVILGQYNCESRNVVLAIRCQGCGYVFFGETSMSVRQYVAQLVFDVEHHRKTRIISDHFRSIGVDYMSVFILQGDFGGPSAVKLIDRSGLLREERVSELKRMLTACNT